MNRFRVLAAVVCAGTLAFAGGCGVIQVDSRLSAKEAQVVEAGLGRFDLSTPPSRDDAGMLEGRDTAIYAHDSGEPLQVEVSLPEGRRLVAEVESAKFKGELGVDGVSTAPPESLDLSRRDLEPADARDRLLRFAEDLHLDTGAIRRWYTAISKRQVRRTNPQHDTGWIRNKLGYLTLEMQGKYNLIGDRADVELRLTWRAP